MKKNWKLKDGDIFEIQLKNTKMYFQFICKDPVYMSSDLIRIFDFVNSSENELNMSEISSNKVRLHTYTRVNQGIKEGYWVKILNLPIEKDFEHPEFRQEDLIASSNNNIV